MKRKRLKKLVMSLGFDSYNSEILIAQYKGRPVSNAEIWKYLKWFWRDRHEQTIQYPIITAEEG